MLKLHIYHTFPLVLIECSNKGSNFLLLKEYALSLSWFVCLYTHSFRRRLSTRNKKKKTRKHIYIRSFLFKEENKNGTWNIKYMYQKTKRKKIMYVLNNKKNNQYNTFLSLFIPETSFHSVCCVFCFKSLFHIIQKW